MHINEKFTRNDLTDLISYSIKTENPYTTALNSLLHTSRDSGIKNVIFNYPATIVFWKDGTKTVVKCSPNDVYDPEKGLAMAICKHQYGDDNYFHKVFKKWLPKEEKKARIRIEKVSTKNCANCKYSRTNGFQEPCICCVVKSKWEPKEEKK